MAFLSVFWMVLKRVWNNRRLEINLLIALIVAMAVISSVPIYTDGALQYVLMQYWDDYAVKNKTAPGSMTMWRTPQFNSMEPDLYVGISDMLEKEAPDLIEMPLMRYQRYAVIDTASAKATANGPVYPRFTDLTNYQDMVDIVVGRFPKAVDPTKEPVEVVVSVDALDKDEYVVGQTYKMLYTLKPDRASGRTVREDKEIPYTIVGTFKPKEEYADSTEWAVSPKLEDNLIIPTETWVELSRFEGIDIGWVSWTWVFDNSDVRVYMLDKLQKGMVTLESDASQVDPAVKWNRGPLQIFQNFSAQSKTLKALMTALSIPILGIVFYYIMLTVQMMVNNRRTEIAMLQSRAGASFRSAPAM